MSVLPVRTHPDAILYRQCRAATDEDFASGLVEQISRDLADTMEALTRGGRRAAGLAAPQIGYRLRVFRLAQWPHPFVNPELEYVLGKPVEQEEECFSLPGVRVPVGRAAKIRLRYLNGQGEPRATKMRDRDARACQHEYDHLLGVTIVQRADHIGLTA